MVKRRPARRGANRRQLIPCLICGSSAFDTVYAGPIRAGRFGNLTPADFAVLRCQTCGIDRLDPVPLDESAYRTGAYRASVDGDSSAETYYANHDNELASKLALVGSSALRGRVVADIGCGPGTFLDLLRGLAARTIGVEPHADFGQVLRAKGHTHYSFPSDAATADPGSVDVAFSFQTIEHVANPLEFLREIATCLKPGGELHLTTPNRNDVLMTVGGESYQRFFYRVAHLWYFDASSLTALAKRADFEVRRISTPYRYDLSNFALWLRDRRPSGVGTLSELAGPANAAFRAQMEASGLGDVMYAVLAKG